MLRRNQKELLAFLPPTGVRSVHHINQAVGVVIVLVPNASDFSPSAKIVELYLSDDHKPNIFGAKNEGGMIPDLLGWWRLLILFQCCDFGRMKALGVLMV